MKNFCIERTSSMCGRSNSHRNELGEERFVTREISRASGVAMGLLGLDYGSGSDDSDDDANDGTRERIVLAEPEPTAATAAVADEEEEEEEEEEEAPLDFSSILPPPRLAESSRGVIAGLPNPTAKKTGKKKKVIAFKPPVKTSALTSGADSDSEEEAKRAEKRRKTRAAGRGGGGNRVVPSQAEEHGRPRRRRRRPRRRPRRRAAAPRSTSAAGTGAGGAGSKPPPPPQRRRRRRFTRLSSTPWTRAGGTSTRRITPRRTPAASRGPPAAESRSARGRSGGMGAGRRGRVLRRRRARRPRSRSNGDARRRPAAAVPGVTVKTVDLDTVRSNSRHLLDDKTSATGLAFDDAYREKLQKEAGAKPSFVHKSKNQIGSLLYNAKQNELKILEGRLQGVTHKAMAKQKYGCVIATWTRARVESYSWQPNHDSRYTLERGRRKEGKNALPPSTITSRPPQSSFAMMFLTISAGSIPSVLSAGFVLSVPTNTSVGKP